MAQWQKEIDRETHLYKMYKNGLSYQTKIGISQSIPQAIIFLRAGNGLRPQKALKIFQDL